MTKKRKPFRQTREYDRVLAYVNRLRAKHLGKKPIKALPKGRSSPIHCPIAHGLGNSRDFGGPVVAKVDRNFIRFSDGEYVYTPRYIQKFVERFDEERIPELMA